MGKSKSIAKSPAGRRAAKTPGARNGPLAVYRENAEALIERAIREAFNESMRAQGCGRLHLGQIVPAFIDALRRSESVRQLDREWMPAGGVQ